MTIPGVGVLRRCLVLAAAIALTASAPRPGGGPGEAADPEFRDPLKQPFSAQSIWNMPVGSGAVYVPAGITAATGWGMTVDHDIIIQRPTAPLTPVHFNADAWTGGTRCAPGAYMYSVPIPTTYTIPGARPDDTPNYAAAVLMPDRRTFKQMQPLTRCDLGGPATAYATYPDVDIYGLGAAGAHGGSALSSVGGTIRAGELLPGKQIRHALKINVDAPFLWGGEGLRYRWPATQADVPNTYTGTNASMKMGALLALPATLDINALALETEPARMIAWTLQNYGGYVVDATGWDVYALAVERGPDGDVETEFLGAWGFSMTPVSRNVPWSRDMARIFTALHVVDNNDAASIGGGGTPLQPLAPPLSTIPPPAPDADGDGCPDHRETGSDPRRGGLRNPNDRWDFFDATRDGSVDLDDVLDVLRFFGSDGLSVEGNIRDRAIPSMSEPWRTAEANDGVDLSDVLSALYSFGHDCTD
jgi:hypothetical protein